MNITFRTLLKELGRPVTGVIHVGTNLGDQARIYSDSYVHHVLWLDRNRGNLSELYNKTKQYPLIQQYITEVFLDRDIHNVSKTFDSFQKENIARLPIENYDTLIIDVEDGSEIRVLQGFENNLSRSPSFIKNIHTKVRGLGDMDRYLSGFGFKQICKSLGENGWGDVLYTR
ncbi:hypothetical protein EBU71_07465 [bacterium]|nr:hypothetical protein [Candidatus Elulimicrobium humile]